MCTPDTACTWTYATPSATVTAATASFDTANARWLVTVTGTGFSGDTSTVEFYVAGRK